MFGFHLDAVSFFIPLLQSMIYFVYLSPINVMLKFHPSVGCETEWDLCHGGRIPHKLIGALPWQWVSSCIMNSCESLLFKRVWQLLCLLLLLSLCVMPASCFAFHIDWKFPEDLTRSRSWCHDCTVCRTVKQINFSL